MTSYLLELREATKVSTGVYNWSFNIRNEKRPETVTVGPCSVSTETDQRNVVILSETFRKSDRNHVLRSDLLKPVLTVVHAEQHFTHSYTAPSTAITEQQILDLVAAGDVRMWLNMHDSQYVLNNALAAASVGESVNRIITQVPGGDMQFFTSGTDKLQYAALGESFGLTAQTASAWQYAVEGTSANNIAEFGNDGLDVFFVKSPPTTSGFEVIWQSNMLRLFWYSNVIQYKDAAGAYVSTGMATLPSTDYVLEVLHNSDIGPPPTASTYFKLTKLSDDTFQEYTGVGTGGSPGGASNAFYISTAQSHHDGVFGSMIHMRNVAASRTLVVNYFKQLYASAPVPEPVTTYQLYDTRKTEIEMDTPAETIRDVQLEFQNDQGVLFDPVDAVVHLRVE